MGANSAFVRLLLLVRGKFLSARFAGKTAAVTFAPLCKRDVSLSMKNISLPNRTISLFICTISLPVGTISLPVSTISTDKRTFFRGYVGVKLPLVNLKLKLVVKVPPAVVALERFGFLNGQCSRF